MSSYTLTEKSYRMKECPRCHQVKRMYNSQKYCTECIPSRRKEYWKEYFDMYLRKKK